MLKRDRSVLPSKQLVETFGVEEKKVNEANLKNVKGFDLYNKAKGEEEAEKRGDKFGAKKLAGNESWDVYEVTSPEQIARLAPKAQWVIAANYPGKSVPNDDGPFGQSGETPFDQRDFSDARKYFKAYKERAYSNFYLYLNKNTKRAYMLCTKKDGGYDVWDDTDRNIGKLPNDAPKVIKESFKPIKIKRI